MSANEFIELTINGKTVEARPGQTIYEVVTEQGIDDIPTLCHAKELEPYASCFVCVVELEGKPNLVPSCATKVAPGMVVNTRNERIIESRRTALSLQMSNHYADCLAPCVLGCPAHVDVQGYIALAARGQCQKAADLIRLTNPLPAVCGRVCVRKCEDVCRRKLVDEAVAINDLKRYIMDSPDAYESWPERAESTGKKVAIVGAGPAGLTAAYYLGLDGHDCTIYEMMPEPGGMLRYAIPSYRLPRDVIAQEIDYIKTRASVRIECNTKLGEDIELAKLREDFDVVFLAMGAIGSNPMRVPGEEDTPGVLKGLEFLIEMAQETKPLKGVVTVIGGGNTAMDAARTANRLGADKVIVVYRRKRAQMPADPLEIVAALEEGVDLVELGAPQELITDKNGRLTGIKCIRMELGEPDESGRRRPVPIEGSEFVQNCDWCISAIGQSPILDGIDAESLEMPELTRWNTLIADGMNYATRVPKVFAGGDVETGPSVVIDCIAAGQKAARSIGAFLENKKIDGTDIDLRDEVHMAIRNEHTAPHCEFKTPIVMRKDLLSEVTESDIGEQVKLQRQPLPEIEAEDRVDNFDEVALGFGWEEAHHEWQRCLGCGCTEVNDCDLRKYCSEYDVTLDKYRGTVRKYQVDDRHHYLILDPNKCILCTKCIRTCEQVLGESALSLVNRGFGAMVMPAMGKALAETPCVTCGSCEAVCPTGALTVKLPFPGMAVVPTTDTETTCGFCSLACSVRVRQAGSGKFWMEPVEDTSKRLCRYGRFGAELYINLERITTPMKREGGQFMPTSYEDAFADIVSDMKHAVDRYGPEEVAVFVSPECSNEQMYLAQRIAREALGTNNISSLSLLLIESEPGTLTPSFGFTASTAERSVLEEADLIVLDNCDLKNEQLILAMDVIKAIKRGAKVVAAAGVHGDIVELGNLNLEPLRGSSTAMWQGISKLMLQSADREAICSVPGGAEYVAALDAMSMDTLLEQSGEKLSRLERCAKLFNESQHVVFIYSPDRTEDQSPGDIVQLANIMMQLKAMDRKCDMLLPRQGSNTAGLETCGAAVEYMPGRQQVPENLLNVTPTRDTLRQRVMHGDIKAAIIIGEDPLRDNKARKFLENLRFLAVVSETMSETANAADVVLPGTNYLEEPGTRVNFEGRVHEFKSVLTPPGGRPGWQVLAGLAGAFRLMGVSDSVAEIREKLRKAVQSGYGDYTPFYWNTNQRRDWQGPHAFQKVTSAAKAFGIARYLTMLQRYKLDAQIIGIKNFRVMR